MPRRRDPLKYKWISSFARRAVIRGKVVNAKNEPVSGAIISASCTDNPKNPAWIGMTETQTNSDGTFRLADVLATKVRMTVSGPANAYARAEVDAPAADVIVRVQTATGDCERACFRQANRRGCFRRNSLAWPGAGKFFYDQGIPRTHRANP